MAVSAPATAASASAAPIDPCAAMGFDAALSGPGVAAKLGGYTPLPDDMFFPAGIIETGGRRIGVVRVGVFEPRGSPAACRAAIAACTSPRTNPVTTPVRTAS